MGIGAEALLTLFLLAGIIGDQHFDDAGLADFVAKARAFADELLS